MPPLPKFLTGGETARAASLLKAGEIVALPTETVYGLAADALNADAVRRIFDAKGRPLLDPLIVHLADAARLGEIAEPSPAALALAERFWPGPLTLVLRRKPVVPDIVTAGLPTVAVRCPAHPLMRRVLEQSGLFLAAPSANPFGYVSPTTAAHVRDSLGERCPWILDGGPCEHGVESTIVLLENGGTGGGGDGSGTGTGGVRARLLRPGPVPWEEIAAVLAGMQGGDGSDGALEGDGQQGGGQVGDLPRPMRVGDPRSQGAPPALPVTDDAARPVAPGMLSRHYSPRTPLTLHAPNAMPPATPPNEARLWQRRPENTTGEGNNRATGETGVHTGATGGDFWFSETGAPSEVARNVFALLRRLDTAGYTRIHVELAPDSPLAPAINDRLRRAAATGSADFQVGSTPPCGAAATS
ncbi:MAG: threonylcarbamoyl-AMP synthase [Puniceicoccales bacterium]|jgi:L-threonylcarbamoyladenylate synthase|nr:threonylcarbamoyl-AMP synthase [Puniceicoccales bacterium]